MTTEICNECGKSVKAGDGLFVDRIPDFSTKEERIIMNKEYPDGDYICRECENKIQQEFEESMKGVI